jgi:hypothetical protein
MPKKIHNKHFRNKLLRRKSAETCVAPTATHAPAGIGHNGCPDTEAKRLHELLGPPKAPLVPPPFDCGAPWTRQATKAELKRLAKLQMRISIREAALSELKAERKRIMNRCIRRMRRADGKN